MMNFVCTLCSSTPGQIQYGGFKRALVKKSGDMIRDRVRILSGLWQMFNTPLVRFVPILFNSSHCSPSS